jgi:hypothetical protein
MPIDVDLYIDRKTNLTSGIGWYLSGGECLYEAVYSVESVDTLLLDELFRLKIAESGARIVREMDVMNTLLLADDANRGASIN